MSRRTTILLAAAALTLGATGVSYAVRGVSGGPDPLAAPTATASPTEVEATLTPSAVPTTPPPTPTTPPSPPPSPSETTPSPSPSPSETAPPKPSYDVEAVQQKLKDLRYYVGPIDGKPGAATVSAVMAFQKVNGLGADGVVGPKTLAALANPKGPSLQAAGPAKRIEVDLSRQVLYYIEGGQVQRILPVSSGNGAKYETSRGTTARSLTPVGWFKIQRHIRGLREADLGSLYDPMYFYRGWAIHGSNSVPAYPASHGCVRVTRADALWLFDRATIGTSVYLYGGTHTFTAGSKAPGTDNPAGDTGAEPTPSPSPSETASPSPTPSETKPSPSPSPSPTKPSPSPSPAPTPSSTPTPSPSASPSSSPSPSPSASASSTPSPSTSPEPAPSSS